MGNAAVLLNAPQAVSYTHLTDTSCYGDQTHAPDLSKVKNGAGESWDMWKAIAAQAKHGEFGNPDRCV